MTIRVNPWVEALEAYVPGEQPSEPGWVKLNTNESPYPPAPEAVRAAAASCAEAAFNKYPDPVSKRLRTAIGERLNFPIEQILVGNGSDEILRLICHAFLDASAGDRIGMTDPTYVLYETLAAMFGCKSELFESAAPDYRLPESLVAADVKVLFLANPNPPIGTYYQNEEIARLAEARPGRLVVVDEAYVDFAPGNALDLVRRHSNVIVTRTFSKSYSLAGLRVGFMIAAPALINAAMKIKDSYNLNRVSQAAAEAAWNAVAYYGEKCETICADRAFLSAELVKRGFTVPASHGNFVFARRDDAAELYRTLRQKRILVRYFNTPSLADGMRITIGTRDELNALLAALDSSTGK